MSRTEKQLQRVRGQFQHDTNAGAERTEGVCIMLVSSWIADGGLRLLEEVADQCNFEALDVKRDDTLGEIVLAKHSFDQELLDYLWKQPITSHMCEGLGLSRTERLPDTLRGNYVRGPARTLRYILERYIGYHLQEWWSKNEKRIKKERENYKRVKAVMES